MVPLHRWPVVAGAWLVAGFISASQFYVAARSVGHEVAFLSVLFWELPVWFIWALLTPLIVVLLRVLPLERNHLAARAGFHVLAAATVSLLFILFWMFWNQAFSSYATSAEGFWAVFWTYFRARFNVGFLLYWAVVGVYYAIANYDRYRARELEASRAHEALARAQLQALRLQLNPHFLFNTLHTVSSLVDEDPKGARRVIARLSELLRTALETDSVQEVPLESELDFLRGYLEIEKVRFGDRLDVQIDIEPDVVHALVPTFLLQPLVENAIRHGIAPREEGGTIWVRAARMNDALTLGVEDDGEGLKDEVPATDGVGLGNAKARLERIYGHRHRFRLKDSKAGGLVVEVEIPFHVHGQEMGERA